MSFALCIQGLCPDAIRLLTRFLGLLVPYLSKADLQKYFVLRVLMSQSEQKPLPVHLAVGSQ